MEFRAADAVRFRHGVCQPKVGPSHDGRECRPAFIGKNSMGESSQIAEWLVSRSVLQTPTYSNQCQAPEWLVGPPEWGTDDAGALVIGGDYRGLGTVRSLGRRKIPVWVLTGEHLIAGVSRYASRSFRLKGTDEVDQVGYLCDLNLRHDLLGWAVFPTGDESAAM